MNSTNSRPRKSLSSKARRKSPVGPRCRAAQTARLSRSGHQNRTAAQQHRPTTLRAESRAWLHAELPTPLERDTALTPEWVAESVVQEVECFLNAKLPAGFTERLTARAYYCYDHNKHFHKVLNRPGNGGRATLYMFMRHWTAGWLKRERYALYRKLPWSYGQGQPLTGTSKQITPKL